MRKLRKGIYFVALIFVACILQACSDHDDPVVITITNNLLSFSATNLSDLNKTKVISTDENITFNWEINLDINGNKSSYSGTSNKNVLPVLIGNEIEVRFNLSADESEAIFTLPDGTIRKLTRAESSFKWIVPQTIKSGDQIIGVSSYREGDAEYKSTGRVLFEVI